MSVFQNTRAAPEKSEPKLTNKKDAHVDFRHDDELELDLL